LFSHATLTFAQTNKASVQSFSQWCSNLDRLSKDQKHTVEALLQVAGTTDCATAEQMLLGAGFVNLNSQQIVDITPLSSLTTLAGLDLSFNQVRDLQPLQGLSSLSFLLLAGNGITDVKPLASLTSLTYLVLEQNQITDVSALSTLVNLTSLNAFGNPIKQKVCPVNPTTICIFSDDAQDLVAQGDSQYQQGQLQEALGSFETALVIYEKGQDRQKQGDLLDRIGDVHIRRGQYATALATYEKALQLRLDLGDLPGTIVSRTSIAQAYDFLGQYNKAAEIFKLAIDNIEDQKQRPDSIPLEGGIYELPRDEAALYTSLADVQNKIGAGQASEGKTEAAQASYEAARESMQQALRWYKEIPDTYYDYKTVQLGQRAALDTLGVTTLNLGLKVQGLDFLQQALTMAKEIGDVAGEAMTLSHLGDFYRGEDPKQAIAYYQQALELERQTGDRVNEGITLNNLGAAFSEVEQWDKARETLLAAIEIWESLRPGLTDENKVSLFETQAATYAQLQTVLIAQGDIEGALEVSERSRARAFVELLASRIGGQVGNRFQAPEPPTIEQIRQVAKTENATLVEYSILGQTLLIWVIQPNGVIDLRSVSLSNLNIEETSEETRRSAATNRSRGGAIQDAPMVSLVQSARNELAGDNSAFNSESRGAATATDRPEPENGPSPDGIRRRPYRPLQEGYDVLIKPIVDLLPTDPAERVIFIPHRSLFLIPFPALQDESRQYLIEKYALSTSPSIQVLALTEAEASQLGTGSKSLVVGNPVMPTIPPALDGKPIQLAPLPGAEQEALEIANLLQTQALTGEAAKESTVVQQMGSSDLIHLATHGLLTELNHLDISVPGAIALAAEAPFQTGVPGPDGLLTSDEIMDLKLNAKLVVLSACNTGRGNITGDGVVGLSRAFISAGVPTVMVSLWSVPDAPTAELMVTFYEQFEQTNHKAAALQEAMLATMQKFPEPSDWAAFTLIGEAF
jgi:CHAT domain-containing protein